VIVWLFITTLTTLRITPTHLVIGNSPTPVPDKDRATLFFDIPDSARDDISRCGLLRNVSHLAQSGDMTNADSDVEQFKTERRKTR
jgi:hypothetical protein